MLHQFKFRIIENLFGIAKLKLQYDKKWSQNAKNAEKMETRDEIPHFYYHNFVNYQSFHGKSASQIGESRP